MGSIECKCGKSIPDSRSIPDYVKGHLLKDIYMDDLLLNKGSIKEVESKAISVLECTQCKRLCVFLTNEDYYNNKMIWYSPDDENQKCIIAS